MVMFSAVVFEGGESLEPDLNDRAVTMTEWTVEEAARLFDEHMSHTGFVWADQPVEWAVVPICLRDTVMLITPTLAQAVKCGVEGGQLYLIRL